LVLRTALLKNADEGFDCEWKGFFSRSEVADAHQGETVGNLRGRPLGRLSSITPLVRGVDVPWKPRKITIRVGGIMDYRHATHRALVGPLALGWTCAALVIWCASVCAQTPQQAAPRPSSAKQQAAAPPRSPAEEDMGEFQLRIRDYSKFVAQHPRIKNLSEEQREKLIEFVAGNMLFVLLP
jgi:hypothetical protein